MSDLLRQEVVRVPELIVVKVGTRVLTDSAGQLDESRIEALSNDLCDVVSAGKKVVLVSSGAVGAGMTELGLAKRPTDVARLQAVAAIGQARLMNVYHQCFKKRGYCAAQMLLVGDDLDDRGRYLNVRNTLAALLETRAIPVINENDTVAVDELVRKFGDNDQLAARITNLMRAGLLIILSDVEGLYDGNPNQGQAKLIPLVSTFDEKIMSFVIDAASGLSRGGMGSKLKAAKHVTTSGENVIVASGRQPHVLTRLLQGEVLGTLFLAQGKSVDSRKRWIGFSVQPRGRLLLDAGAVQAIVKQGGSLLAIGIVGVEGTFSKGDSVSLCDGKGVEFGRGLTNYNAADISKIRGLRSDRISQVLGDHGYDEVVHRNNLMLHATD
jgi:glutamate 5-kinase